MPTLLAKQYHKGEIDTRGRERQGCHVGVPRCVLGDGGRPRDLGADATGDARMA
jgi:hypothetical protein